jgi:hydrogenase maturation protease
LHCAHEGKGEKLPLKLVEPTPTKPVQSDKARCLVLACGNTLRSDDGVGAQLAAWAEERFRDDSRVRVIARQQFTPDLAEDIAAASSVLFVDASVKSPPGRVRLTPVSSRVNGADPASHHLSPTQLLGLTRSLYGSIKSHAMLLTVGAASTELGESFSVPVAAALPRAQGVLEKAVLRFLAS